MKPKTTLPKLLSNAGETENGRGQELTISHVYDVRDLVSHNDRGARSGANPRDKKQPELQTPQHQLWRPLIAAGLQFLLRTKFFAIRPMLVKNRDQRQEHD